VDRVVEAVDDVSPVADRADRYVREGEVVGTHGIEVHGGQIRI
jgi:hypothetical protein